MKTLTKILTTLIEDYGVTDEIIEQACREYQQQELRKELIKFAQRFYSDKTTCKYNVDKYLKDRK